MNEHLVAVTRDRVIFGAAAAILMLSVASCDNEPTTVELEPGPPNELLYNADAEGGQSSPDEWRSIAGSAQQYLLEWVDGKAARGRRSLGVRSSSPTLSPAGAYWYQYVPITRSADVDYVLTAAVKLEQMAGAGAAIAIRGDDTTLNNSQAEVIASTQLRQNLTGTQDWARVSVTLSGASVAINQLTVYLLHLTNSSGAVYFDDLSLSVVPRSAP
jgi:hypothetical protein